MSYNAIEALARRRAGGSAGWKCSSYRAIDGGTLVEGSETEPITRGPRRGRPRWIGEKWIGFVSRAEQAAEEARYEQETGNCHQCESGQKAWRWSVENGRETRPCERCSGTGRIS